MDAQKEQEFFNARVKENEDKIYAELKRIFQKHHLLTQEEKAFLQARSSYLTRAEIQEYREELREDLHPQDTEEEKPEEKA